MLKLRMFDSDKEVVINPCNIVSVSIEKHEGYKMLQVETKDQGILYGDFLSPEDREEIQL